VGARRRWELRGEQGLHLPALRATSTASSWLLDASAGGTDAFITTRAQLVAQDQNGNFDVYDARVGGSEPLTPPACTGSGCQGVPPAPPIFATPSSVTFEGVGNFAPAVTGNAKQTQSKSKSKKKSKETKKSKRGKRGRAHKGHAVKAHDKGGK
jgi:hypothetical protein